MNNVLSRTALSLLLFLVVISGYAKESKPGCSAEDPDCVAVGSWDFAIGVGLGGRTNPVIGNDDIPIVLLPSISYYGKRFFWETDTLGFTLVETSAHMVNVIATVSYDQTYFHDLGIGNFSIEGGSEGAGSGNVAVPNLAFDENASDAPSDGPQPSPSPTPVTGGNRAELQVELEELHDRDMSGLVGLEYSWEGERSTFGVQVLQDATSVHNGKQVRVALSNLLYQSDRTNFFANIGAEWKDSKTLDYYYGIRPNEVDNQADAYIVDDDTSYYLKFDWGKRISSNWELKAILHHRWFGRSVYESPLVEDKNTVAVFLGGVYHF